MKLVRTVKEGFRTDVFASNLLYDYLFGVHTFTLYKHGAPRAVLTQIPVPHDWTQKSVSNTVRAQFESKRCSNFNSQQDVASSLIDMWEYIPIWQTPSITRTGMGIRNCSLSSQISVANTHPATNNIGNESLSTICPNLLFPFQDIM